MFKSWAVGVSAVGLSAFLEELFLLRTVLVFAAQFRAMRHSRIHALLQHRLFLRHSVKSTDLEVSVSSIPHNWL